MVAPTLTSEHPGLEVLAEVAKVLAAGRPAEEGLADVVGVLQRGSRCAGVTSGSVPSTAPASSDCRSR